MSTPENKKALVFSILDFLQKSCEDGTINKDDTEGIEVAMQCIGEAFGVDASDEEQKKLYSTKPATLLSIFDVYLKTKKATADKSVSEENKKAAEEKKAMGNRKVTERNYPEAIKLYTEAIELDGTNAVYYANRAAAYSQQGDHEKAVNDAKKAIEIDPKYSKAYSRMGHAYFCLNKFDEAVEAYEKGLELDPNNATIKNSLATAKSKMNAHSVERSADTSSSSNQGGLPNLGAGGMPDLGSLLNNPALMNMAQQMMQSGALDNLMNNPEISRMAQQMMSGGGMPNLQDMMSNPELMRLARDTMGGRGDGSPKPDTNKDN
ncbi:uncharacterized protein BX663DRAFT_75858 [Cokeromyces recurvatus]|uniref:uncharacterized protein n=1 Tax=Cokeromyces recurvatus TaxID=90255 RepID=UPI002220A3A2|nr:uncharacterized protein BX663DRAFT_75858 [Cokeromyces recurvatus]KAI7902452.1 hypothetical protein BX663DRAFT_75858 [Cokeromyces recurvatus]